MAEITSAQSGNWSDTNTWTGGIVPGDGDLAIIGAHTITIDQNIGTAGNGIKNIILDNASSVLQYDGTTAAASYTIRFASTGIDPVGATAYTAAGWTGSDATMFGIAVAKGYLNISATASKTLTVAAATAGQSTYIAHNRNFRAYVNAAAKIYARYLTVTRGGENVTGFSAAITWERAGQGATETVDIQNCTFTDPYRAFHCALSAAYYTFSNNTISGVRYYTVESVGTLNATTYIEGNTETNPAHADASKGLFFYSASGAASAGAILYIRNNDIRGSATKIKNLAQTGVNAVATISGNTNINVDRSTFGNVLMATTKAVLVDAPLNNDKALMVIENNRFENCHGIQFKDAIVRNNDIFEAGGVPTGVPHGGTLYNAYSAIAVDITGNLIVYTSLTTATSVIGIFSYGVDAVTYVHTPTVTNNTIVALANPSPTQQHRGIRFGQQTADGDPAKDITCRNNIIIGFYWGINDDGSEGNTYIPYVSHNNSYNNKNANWKRYTATANGFDDRVNSHPNNAVYGDLEVDPLFVNPSGATRADFAPKNTALKGTGYGGVDIGAVAVQVSGGTRRRHRLLRAV